MKKAVVIGATLMGMQKASQLSRDGYHVVLLSRGAYLLQDIIETWRYHAAEKRETLHTILDKASREFVSSFDIDSIVTPIDMKQFGLYWMKCMGIEIHYMSYFIGLTLGTNETLTGVLIADKWGIHHIPCCEAWDATMYDEATALVTKGPRIFLAGTQGVARFELMSIEPITEKSINRVRLCQGFMGNSQYIAEFDYTLPNDMTMPQIREYVLDQTVFAFVTLGSVTQFDALPGTALPLSLDLYAQKEPSFALKGWNNEGENEDDPIEILIAGKRYPWLEMDGCPTFNFEKLPLFYSDVCIVGIGTGGVWAAISASRQGADVIGIELNAYPGGTRTLGGVSGFYYGNRSKLFSKQLNEIQSFSKKQFSNEDASIINPVTEMIYYSNQMKNIKYIPCSIVCGVQVMDGHLDRILVAGEQGFFTIRAKQYIDATGDGDLAVLCGCSFSTGDDDTGVMQNYSQWNRCIDESMGKRNVDQDTIDNTKKSEWTRALENNVANAKEYDLYDMLTIRESRRVHGNITVKMANVARETRYHDVLIEAYSTYDPHGRCLDVIGRLGLMPNLGKARFVSVPLRAVTVPQINNILIAGKAISFSQNAFNYIRMNADIMSLGWAEGYLAATCIEDDIRKVSLQNLQRDMRQLAVITYNIPLNDEDTISPHRLASGVQTGDRSAYHEALLIENSQIAQLLMTAMQQGIQMGDLAQRTLLFYGKTHYAQQVYSRLQNLEKKGGQEVYYDRQNKEGVIRGGFIQDMPDDYWDINQLAVLLSIGGYHPASSIIASMMLNTPTGDTWVNDASPYALIRIDCQTLPNYDRLLCLATCALLMPNKAYVNPLQQMFKRVNSVPIQGASFYKEYLLLKIAEALWKCNPEKGRLLLAQFNKSSYAVIRQAVKSFLLIDNNT